MLAVGRALLTEPKLLMVDEMSLGLAPIIVQPLLPDRAHRRRRHRRAACCSSSSTCSSRWRSPTAPYVLAHGDLVLEGAGRTYCGSDRHLLESSYLGESAIDDDPLAATHP